jgi:hypothetical protein
MGLAIHIGGTAILTNKGMPFFGWAPRTEKMNFPPQSPWAYRRDGSPVEGEGWNRGVEEGC